jgi:hypothetical protein
MVNKLSNNLINKAINTDISEEIKFTDNKAINNQDLNEKLYDQNLSLETEILYYIEQKFPDYYHDSITKPKKVKIEHLSNMFNEFKEISSDKEKHNLKWAFKKANEAFNFEELQKVQPKTDCFMAYDEVVCAVHRQSKKKINNFSKKFSRLSFGVSMLDIMVSVALILVVTMLSHIGDEIFDTLLFSTLFIASVALVKVSLDRFAIIPVIDRYGWKLFNRTINYAREEAIKLNAVYLVLMESINRKESVDTRLKIIKKQKRELITHKGFFSIPYITFAKPSDV